MRKVIAFFTSNWGLKILALLLAIGVYYSMKETSLEGRSKASSSLLKGPLDGGQ